MSQLTVAVIHPTQSRICPGIGTHLSMFSIGQPSTPHTWFQVHTHSCRSITELTGCDQESGFAAHSRAPGREAERKVSATRGEGWLKGSPGRRRREPAGLCYLHSTFSKEGLRGSVPEALHPLHLARHGDLNPYNISCSRSMTPLKRADPSGHLLPDCLPGLPSLALCTCPSPTSNPGAPPRPGARPGQVIVRELAPGCLCTRPHLWGFCWGTPVS